MARRGTLLCFIRAHATLDQPLVPANWDVIQEDNRWSSIIVNGNSFHMRLIFRKAGNPGRAMFVCVGPPAVLTKLTEMIASDGLAFTETWASLPDFRADARAPVVTLKSEWPEERPIVGADINGNGGVRTGTKIALWARMAGFDDDDAEV